MVRMLPPYVPRDEEGATLLQTAIAIVLMFAVAFGTVNVALAYYSAAALEAELARSVTQADLDAVIASGNPADALRREVLDGSSLLLPESLVVSRAEVTPLDAVEETAQAREVEGSSAEKVTRIREMYRVEATVLYEVPGFSVTGGEGTVLEHDIDSVRTVETRIEVS